MKNKTAIVTGAGRGIGRCVAAALLDRGARVILAEIDPRTGRLAERELRARGEVRFVRTDVASERSVAAMVRAAVRAFGRLDLLVNNAGFMRRAPLARLKVSDWNRVLAVDLTGPMLCAKHALPHLRRTKGAIVNIASTRALMSEADTESYSAAKGGLVALTHALAVSFGPAVRVNCISPGWIDTRAWRAPAGADAPRLTPEDHRQHPCGRVGRPEDVAALVLFLAGPDSGFVTGQNFVVDGGMTKKMIYGRFKN